jgi:hypothetical protein
LSLVFVGGDSIFCANLLRSYFATQSIVCCPPPLQLISAQAHAYSNFETARAFLREYSLVDEDRDTLFRQLIAMVLQRSQTLAKASYLVEASPQNHLYFPLLARLFPDAGLVFMTRDGRDVVASLLASSEAQVQPGGEDTRGSRILMFCTHWLNCLDSGLRGIQAVAETEKKTLILKYEEFFEKEKAPRLFSSLLFQEFSILDWVCPIQPDFIDAKEPVWVPGSWREFFTREESLILRRELHEPLLALGYLEGDPW